VLVPEKFLKVWPGESCGQRFATAELVNTYWKLTRIGEEAVVLRENQREPHLILRLDEQRVSGSTGCNQIVGTYRLEGASLLFGPVASTMMACEAPVSATERRFLQALTAARRWSVRGEHLELYDETGGLLARFESRYMK
jgi:heat shock protein HslJ